MEMTYEIYRYIFIGGAILSGIMLAVSVFVFFLLRIPTVIGDLTGANARKAIENIRSHNESTGDKTYKSSQVNRERGKLTDKISPSGRLLKDPSLSLHGAMSTEKISTQRLAQQDAGSETTVLGSGAVNETSVLGGGVANETTVLGGGAVNETTVLGGAPCVAGETTVLAHEDLANETTLLNTCKVENVFVVEYEITYIHTAEVIA